MLTSKTSPLVGSKIFGLAMGRAAKSSASPETPMVKLTGYISIK